MPKEYATKYYVCKNCKSYVQNKNYVCCEYPDIKEVKFKITDDSHFHNWGLFRGNVVKWGTHSRLYIVVEIKEKSAVLLPLDATNASAHPSVDWPWNPNERINSIKVVAQTVQEYILESLLSAFKR